MRGRVPYVVIGEVEDPTAVQCSAKERREMQQAKQKGDRQYADYLRGQIEGRRPTHRVFIVTDDPAVKDWGKGERRSVRAEIIGATLEGEPWGIYVRASIAVRMEGAGAAGQR
jgi:hypothetical protein